MFDAAIAQVTLDGLWLEFGVATGRTINYIAAQAPSFMYGFDSFDGLPEDFTASLKEGAFRQDKLPDVMYNVWLEVGLFQDTLEPFLAENCGDVAYVHLDADLYSSTHYVLFTLAKHRRIHPGCIIQLDDIFYYEAGESKWYTDEFRALLKFVRKFGVRFEWIGYSSQRAAIKIRSLNW